MSSTNNTIDNFFKSTNSLFKSTLIKHKTSSQEDFDKELNDISSDYYFPIKKGKQSLYTDDEYDTLEKLYESRFGKRNKIGVTPSSNDDDIILIDEECNHKIIRKVLLPRYLGGLDKLKTEKDLQLFINRNEKLKTNNNSLKNYSSGASDAAILKYIYYDKLDGIAAELEQIDGVQKLYKRGDETHGSDITCLLKYFNIPKLPKDGGVRGELVIPNSVFNNKYSRDCNSTSTKDKKNERSEEDSFCNPRNMVAGITNSKTFDEEALSDIHFVVYELYPAKGKKAVTKSEQLNRLKKYKFNVCYHADIDIEDLNEDNLTRLIKYRKTKTDYDIDGAVISADIVPPKLVKDNPKYMAAFKIQGECALAKVINVQWNVSKHGLYKPRVQIEPTKISGITISNLSGHNARNIVDNGIGPGAEVLITRSGDVIPYIKEVTEQVIPQLPEEGTYEWNENEVEIRIVKENMQDNEKMMEILDEQNIKQIYSFFETLDVKFLGHETVKKLYDSGYTTIKNFLCLTEEDILEVDTFKKASASRIVNNIQNAIQNVPLHKVIAATGLGGIGMGERKMKKITDKYPNILELLDTFSREEIEEKVQSCGGFVTTLSQAVDSLYSFKDWITNHQEIILLNENISKNEHKENSKKYTKTLQDKNIVFSGKRDSLMERKIEDRGGKVKTGVSKTTNFVLVPDVNLETTKTTKGREVGAEIITLEDFERLYLVA
jgi:DNA ligase (NAD+)